MTVKSESLSLTTSNQTLLTCGAGLEIVVFGLAAHNTSGAERTVTLRHYQNATARTVDHVIKVPATAPASAAWPAKIALQPSDTLQAKTDATTVTLLWSYDQDAGADPVATNFNPRGAYDSGATYAVNDVVSDAGTSYISRVAGNIGHTPASSPTYWMVNAAKGDAGSSGTAAGTTFTPTGGLAATDVQAALAELDSEKQTAAQVTTAINSVIASAPGALDTLNELAAALGNDANFATTVTTALATKAAKGANSDITALSGLTTALSVAQGGTGRTSATAHGVLIGNGTSAVAVTGAGTAGQVLTSNGASADPTFQAAAGGGAWVYLSTVTASNSASVDVDATIDGTYDTYVIEAVNILVATVTDKLWCRLKLGGSYIAGDYSSHVMGPTPSSTSYVAYVYDGQADLQITGPLYNTVGFGGCNLTMVIKNPASTTSKKHLYWQGAGMGGGANPVYIAGSGYCNNSTSALTGIRFKASSGNITSGTFRLYGIKNS